MPSNAPTSTQRELCLIRRPSFTVRQPKDLAGDYVGFDGFFRFYERKRAGSGDGFGYRVDELLVNDTSAAAVLTLSALREETLEEWKQVAIFRIQQDRIVEIWIVEDAPDDGIWHVGTPGCEAAHVSFRG